MKHLEETRSKSFRNFIEGLRKWEQLEEEVVWMGDGWKWTLEFRLKGHKAHKSGPDHPDAFAYVVCDPSPEPVRPSLWDSAE